MNDLEGYRDLSVKMVDTEILKKLKIISAQETLKMSEVLAMLVDLYDDTEYFLGEE